MADNGTTGNSFLDTLNGVYGIAGNAFDRYTQFLSASNTAKVESAQNFTVPDIVVNTPSSNGNNFLSNPENIQKSLLIGGVGLFAIAGIYILIKKF